MANLSKNFHTKYILTLAWPLGVPELNSKEAIVTPIVTIPSQMQLVLGNKQN